MRISYLIGLILLFVTLSSVAFSSDSNLESRTISVSENFYATTAAAVPQVYTYVVRAVSGQTENTINFQSDTSSFSSIKTNVPYRVGTITLSHYKLAREPISKFSLAKRTYEYITLDSNTTIIAGDGVSSTISFSVDKAWIVNSGGLAEQVALYVYDDTWKKLDTRLISSSGSRYEFEAYASTFGYFAIALDRPLTTQSSTTTTTQGAQGSQSTSNSATTTSSNSPQSIDTKTTQPVEVVYPLLDSQDSSAASGLWQKVIGFGLLIFALTGVAIVGVTVVQSRRGAPTQFKPTGSVNDLLTRLQSSRANAVPKQTRYSSDVNALLAKVNARYQPSVSASMPKFQSMQSSLMSTSSSFANTLSHSLDDLKSKVAELEPDIVKRYTDWGMSHGHSIDMIKKDLLEHEIDEELINRVLHNSKKY